MKSEHLIKQRTFLKSLTESLLQPEPIISLALFLTTFFIYLQNLSPSVFGGDSGDILTAAITKGVAHPSGYPTITMLGNLFSRIPLGETLAWRVGLTSVLFSSLTVVLMYLTTMILTKKRLLSLVTAFTLGFLYPFWLYAEVVEVFALNSFFILLLIYLTLLFQESKHKKYLLALSFCAGLSLTNNQVIFLLFPSITLYIFLLDKKLIKDFKLIFSSFLCFMIGLLPYLYIPFAALDTPPVNWGNAVTLNNFIALITRQQYGWGVNSTQFDYSPIFGLEPAYIYWKTYITPLLPLVSLLGVLQLIRQKRGKLLLFLLSAFLLLGPFFLVYGHREDIIAIARLGIMERFLIQSALVVVVFFPLGIEFLIYLFSYFLKKQRWQKIVSLVTVLVFVTVPISSYLTNKDITNFSTVYLGDSLGKDILASAPTDGILLLITDNYIFNTLYVQNAYGQRPDVQLTGAHTGFTALFQHVIADDEAIRNYNVRERNLIEKSMLEAGLVTTVPREHLLVDVGGNLQVTQNKQLILVPHGLLQEVYFSDSKLPTKEEFETTQNDIWREINFLPLITNAYIIENNLILSDIKATYVLAKLRAADFARLYYQDEKLAKEYEVHAQILAGDHPLDQYRIDLQL